MKLRLILVVLTMLSAVIFTYDLAVAGVGGKSVIRGTVVNVYQDEEGSNVIMNVNGKRRSVYVPSSNANENTVIKAIEAQKTKSMFSITLQ